MLDWLRRKLGSGPDRALDWRRRVASFRRLLGRSAELCGLVAELEAELRVAGPDEPRVRERMRRALATSLDLVQDLSELRGGGVEDLFAAHERLEREVAGRLRRAQRPPSLPLVVAIEAPEARSREQAGGKAGNLAELRTVLPHAVPPGFVATTAAYRAVAGAAGLPDKLVGLLVAGRGGEAALAERAAELRRLIETTSVPEPLAQAIAAHGAQFPEARRWAVRSSGVGEDGTLSFAGQFDTLLGVLPQGLVDAYRAVVASRFSERALAYCQGAGLAVLGTPMAVLFLPMIPAAAAGVLYTRDPHDPHAPTMWIAATWGLGLDLVGGRASADLFVVAREPAGRIIETRLARKETAIELAEDSPGLASRTLGPEQRDSPALDAAAVRELALLGLRAERHFGGAQDIEWALDRAGKLWLVQSRPLVLSAGRAPAAARHRVLLHGRPLAPGRAVGHVHRALTDAEIDATPEGAVLVVRQATAELARVLGRLGAVVAELGQNDGAALLRQAGVPAVGDAAGAFARLEPGEPASVDGSRGEIYAGILWPELRAPRRGAGIQSPDARFFHDRIVRLALVDPATGNPRGEGCGSVHDLGRLVHERAVDAMLGLGERRSRARRLDAPLPLDLRLLDLGGAVAEQARAAARPSRRCRSRRCGAASSIRG
ncbi:MAG: hypothetical protein HY744_05620 [Deltaproteobacteria bacterium]|nr:hypothetical protein [Deltaproteobacteria bacterium]